MITILAAALPNVQVRERDTAAVALSEAMIATMPTMPNGGRAIFTPIPMAMVTPWERFSRFATEPAHQAVIQPAAWVQTVTTPIRD